MSASSDEESYDECMEKAKLRYARGELRLCPKGYCTAKRKFEVYPSAYANGYAVQVCTGTKPDWEGDEGADRTYYDPDAGKQGGLTRWFKEEWVNVCETRADGPGGFPPCGSGRGVDHPDRYPYCRPLHRLPGTTVATVHELTEAERADMCRWKRSLPQGVGGDPTRVLLPAVTRERVRRGRAVRSSHGSRSTRWRRTSRRRGARA